MVYLVSFMFTIFELSIFQKKKKRNYIYQIEIVKDLK